MLIGAMRHIQGDWVKVNGILDGELMGELSDDSY